MPKCAVVPSAFGKKAVRIFDFWWMKWKILLGKRLKNVV